jgi:hypothetical protein
MTLLLALGALGLVLAGVHVAFWVDAYLARERQHRALRGFYERD